MKTVTREELLEGYTLFVNASNCEMWVKPFNGKPKREALSIDKSNGEVMYADWMKYNLVQKKVDFVLGQNGKELFPVGKTPLNVSVTIQDLTDAVSQN